jgi:hypothetical protein
MRNCISLSYNKAGSVGTLLLRSRQIHRETIEIRTTSQTAAEVLVLIDERGGDSMMARIGVMRALRKRRPESGRKLTGSFDRSRQAARSLALPPAFQVSKVSATIYEKCPSIRLTVREYSRRWGRSSQGRQPSNVAPQVSCTGTPDSRTCR